MVYKKDTREYREKWINFIYALQQHICSELEAVDGKSTFKEDDWQRAEGKGGGGKTRIISSGNIFEKGGVNTSVVYGVITDKMRKHLQMDGHTWFACGISLVVHPYNPFVPTVHCNYRLFEVYNEDGTLRDRWFGGGTDLTPYYLFDEDAQHFHGTYKKVCDDFNPSFYAEFKNECDDYFINTHRNKERRGIGGIFYDHARADESQNADFWFDFAKACGYAFTDAYIPIVQKRKDLGFQQKHKHWQEIRRGRYVEFNLVHDRGTLFGLKTNGRTESILMSLPPTVRFEYDYQPQPGSEEDRLLQACLQPQKWIIDV